METVWNIEKLKPEHKPQIRIFRGQTKDWKLLPRLFRHREDVRIDVLRNLESWLLEQFRNSPYLLPSLPEKEFDRISLAQHYGLDTRLLDWSRNPLMGLFFAVNCRQPEAPTVYLYDATLEQINEATNLRHINSRPDFPVTVIYEPIAHSQRVMAQAGMHTVHSLREERIRPMEELADDSGRIVKIPVDPSQAGNIRSELRQMGIRSATVYGDLGAVCKELLDEAQDLGIDPAQLPTNECTSPSQSTHLGGR
jgi:hypothetical protein